MSTNVLGFQSFFKFFVTFCIGQTNRQQIKGYNTIKRCISTKTNRKTDETKT